MKQKIVSLQQAASLIHEGDHLAVSGTMEMAPMAMIRALIRQGSGNLHLTCVPSSAIGADMLIGAGLVRSVEFAQIALGEYGLAPHFKRLAEKGEIILRDHV